MIWPVNPSRSRLFRLVASASPSWWAEGQMKRIAAISLALLVAIGALVDAQSIQSNPAPGSYSHNIVVSFVPPPPELSLSYSIVVVGAKETSTSLERYTTPLVFTALPGERRSYQVTAELLKGDTVVESRQLNWTIDRSSTRVEQKASASSAVAPTKPPTSIPLLSPVQGSFADRQLLFVNDSGFLWVRYTTDGSNPLQSGRVYTGPTLLPETGDVELRVAALAVGADQPLSSDLHYSVSETAAAPLRVKSGLYPSSFKIQPPTSGVYYYSFDEHSPGLSDPVLDHELTIGAPPSSAQYSALRLRQRSDGKWGPEYRYFFSVDRRAAPKPLISLLGGSIATPKTTIHIESAPYTRVYYTTDGQEPTTSSTRYTGSFSPELPSLTKGTLTVRARAYAPNGKSSEVATAEYPYTTIPPKPPEITVQGGSTTNSEVHILVHVPPGSFAVYERSLDGTTPPDPTRTSPRAPAEMLLSLPRGVSLPFDFKFATIDETGTLSPVSKLIQVTVDQVPPPEPTLSFTGGQLTVSSKATVVYALSDNGVPPQSLGIGTTVYSEPLDLSGSPNERVVYYVEAQALGDNGLRSAVVRGGPFIVDRRLPAHTIYWGISPGGIYNTDRTLKVEQSVGEQIHYTLSTNGTPPEDPTSSSPLLTGPTQFSVPKGSEKAFVLKIRTEVGEKLGPVTTVPFRIDRIPPEVPEVSGLAQSGPFDHAVTLNPPTMPLGETLYISISSDGAPGDPLGSAGQPFEAPIQLDAPHGEQRSFDVRLAAKDAAGNVAEGPKMYRLMVDRQIPDTPEIVADPGNTTVIGQVQITLTGSAPFYRYELTDNGSDPPIPSGSSKRYSSQLLLEPKNGVATLYSLVAVAESSSGTLSPPSAVYRVLVEPQTSNQSTEQNRLTAAAGGSPAAAPIKQPLLIGASNGGLYNSARTLHATSARAIIRYEVDPNGGDPPPVTRFSPILTKDIPIDPAFGETRRYAVRAAAFGSRDSSAALARQLLRFTIDRTPPPPPTITGITDNARYQQPESFTLQAASGTIYYSLDRLTPFLSAGSVSSTKFTPYQSPVRIGVGEAAARYRIHAYTMDAAGNRSTSTPEWTVYFDRGVVYAAPSGSDSNDGTSSLPVKSLSHAIELAQANNRNTIFLASGHYTLDKVYTVSSGFSILGDFNPSNWHQESGTSKPTTFISTAPGLTATGPLFAVKKGGLSLDRIQLTDARPSGSLFHLDNGALSVSDASLLSTESTDATIVAHGGTVSLEQVSVENRGGGHVLSASGSTVDVSGSAFAAGPTTGDSVVIALAGKSNGSIADSVLRPSSGLRTIALSVTDSKLSIQKSELVAGSSTRQSVALSASGAHITITGSRLVGSAHSHLSFGVQASASTLDISGSTIEAAGSVGATGIWADSSNLRLIRSKVVGTATSEFLYLLKLTDSHVLVSSSILRGARTGDFLGISLTRSPAKLVGNTFYGGEGSGDSSVVSLEDTTGVAIVDNIFASSAPGQGEAITSDGALPSVIANDFAGFSSLLTAPSLPNGLRTLGELNGYSLGVKIEGNISERLDTTFRSLSSFELKASSACIAGGVDPSSYGGVMLDFAGQHRSAPFDIGALRHR